MNQYSFKILVHEVLLQCQEHVILSDPQICVSLSSFPKLIIRGHLSIQNRQQSVQKAFNHGKSAIIQMQYERLIDLINNQPLEIMLLDGNKLLCGAKLKINQFIDDIDPNLDQNHTFKFRRGSFHLHTNQGAPYSLIDISISLSTVHSYQQQVNQKKAFLQVIKQNELSNQSIDPLENKIDSFLMPQPQIEEMDQNNKNTINNNNNNINNNNNYNINKNNNNNINRIKQTPSDNRQKTNGKKNNLKKNSKKLISSIQPQKLIQNKNTLTTKNSQQSQRQQQQQAYIQQESLPDMSIADFVKAAQCPPPMVVDTKVQVIEYFQSVQKHIVNNNNKAKMVSVEVQTEAMRQSIYKNNNNNNNNNNHNENKSTIEDKSLQGLRSMRSEDDAYPEDFESIAQSQQQLKGSQLFLKKQHPNFNSPNNIKKNKQNEIDDQISEIYSDEFEQYNGSQSQSLRRTTSLDRVGNKFNRNQSNNFDEIQESYAQDFESISQSYQSKAVPKLKR